MARTSNYTYDPSTGSWSQSESSSSDSSTASTPSSSDSGSDNLTSASTDKESGAGKTAKKYNEIEVNTLSGSLTFIATNETIKLKAGDTVTLNGLGSHLSGNYYVKDVTRQISSNGYSHSATLIKTDFGSSLLMDTPVAKGDTVPSTPTAGRTYTVKKGDCLWKIAKEYYGNGSSYGTIYDANTKKIADPHWIYPGQVFVIP